MVYWPKAMVEEHKRRFVKAQSFSPWNTDFDKMAKKTVLKHTLSTWGILSVELQKAITTDEGTPTDMDGTETTFSDISDAPDHVLEYPVTKEESHPQPPTTPEVTTSQKEETPQPTPSNNNPISSIF